MAESKADNNAGIIKLIKSILKMKYYLGIV